MVQVAQLHIPNDHLVYFFTLRGKKQIFGLCQRVLHCKKLAYTGFSCIPRQFSLQYLHKWLSLLLFFKRFSRAVIEKVFWSSLASLSLSVFKKNPITESKATTYYCVIRQRLQGQLNWDFLLAKELINHRHGWFEVSQKSGLVIYNNKFMDLRPVL